MCKQVDKVDPDGQAAGPGGAAHSELLPQLPDLGRGGQGRTCCSSAGSILASPRQFPCLIPSAPSGPSVHEAVDGRV